MWATGSQGTLPGQTLARIRGEYAFDITSITSLFDGFDEIGLGICLVSENAFNAGVASVPSSIADIGWDGWMWHALHAHVTGFSTIETGRGPMEAVRGTIDTKAMRKEKATDVLIGVIELGTETGTCGLDFFAFTRLLVFLP